MKTIVFIGTNKSGSSYEAIKASENLNYYTVLLTDRKSFFDKRLDFPHVHSMRMCDMDSIDGVRSAISRLAEDRFMICAIVSFIDPHCHTAAVLAREFGLKSFTGAAIATMLDKIKSREALSGTPYSPPYHVINGGEYGAEAMPGLPLILKAPVSSSSKDVHMATTAGQYQGALAELRRRYPDAPILVEKYINGPQYLVETLTINGKVNIIAVVEQEITFSGRFIITGYQMVTDENSALFYSLEEAVGAIINAHGMRDGPCHLELRRIDGQWKLIEANPRISGGAMNLFVETAYGVNLAKETLKFALGLSPDLRRKYTKETFLQYVVVPREGVLTKVTGKSMALSSPGALHVYVKPKKGSVLLPPASMGHRYAYVIGTGESASDARKNAKTAASKIKFHLRAIGDECKFGNESAGDGNVYIGMGEFSNNTVCEP